MHPSEVRFTRGEFGKPGIQMLHETRNDFDTLMILKLRAQKTKRKSFCRETAQDVSMSVFSGFVGICYQVFSKYPLFGRGG